MAYNIYNLAAAAHILVGISLTISHLPILTMIISESKNSQFNRCDILLSYTVLSSTSFVNDNIINLLSRSTALNTEGSVRIRAIVRMLRM